MVLSLRLARADFKSAQPDLLSLEQACRLAPGGADYWLKAAHIREVEGSDDPLIDENIAHALRLNPRYTEAWMARAVRAETHGRIDEAERDYAQAAEVDRMYKPAWALANFYVRQNQPDKFWIYARKCLETVEPRRLEPSSYDPAPLFELAWRITQDPGEIRRKLIPHRHFIQADYLEYLSLRDMLGPATGIARDLTAYGDANDSYILLNLCERLINSRSGGAAVEIWNAMIASGALHSLRLDPPHGISLGNGDLKKPFERAGFDWRFQPSDGVLENHFADIGEVRFEFTGDQEEAVLPIFQPVPVVAGNYRFSFRYRTPAMSHTEGLSWQLWDYSGQRQLPIVSKLDPHEDWSAGEATFTIPPGLPIVRLGLVCNRVPGSTRIRGGAAFQSFELALSK